MDDLELLRRLGLALAIGLLFGLERGWHDRARTEGDRIAGIRTFALTALFGGICGWLVTLAGPVVLAVALAGLAGVIAVSYWIRADENDDLGLTTEIAALLTFVLGAASVLGEMVPVAATAVVATALLSAKAALHGWIEEIEHFELTAAIKLAVISVVILPLLPNRGYGPGEVLNPYQLWWAVVVVAGLSFFGYVAIRVAGPRLGVLITGMFGGLASSTSTTLAFSRMARENRALGPILAIGIVLAGSITFLRILVVATIFNRSLMSSLMPPLTVMALVGFAGALMLRSFTAGAEGSEAKLERMSNPLELRTALGFGVFLTTVVLATHYLEIWLGTTGIFAAAALSGVADVDAVTVSIARMTGSGVTAEAATLAIVLAVSVNTAVKGGIALVVGGAQIGMRVIAVYAAVIAAGAITAWLA